MSTTGLNAFTLSLILTGMLRPITGSYRGLSSRRVVLMLVAIFVGSLMMVVNGRSPRDVAADITISSTEKVLFVLGAGLFLGGALVGLGSLVLRMRALHHAMDRLDGYVQGSAPLPFPMENEAARRDLAAAARLLDDPALSKRFPTNVHDRVAELMARALEMG